MISSARKSSCKTWPAALAHLHADHSRLAKEVSLSACITTDICCPANDSVFTAHHAANSSCVAVDSPCLEYTAYQSCPVRETAHHTLSQPASSHQSDFEQLKSLVLSRRYRDEDYSSGQSAPRTPVSYRRSPFLGTLSLNTGSLHDLHPPFTGLPLLQ